MKLRQSGIQEKIESFFKPSAAKLIIFVVAILYVAVSFVTGPWGYGSSPLPLLLLSPLLHTGMRTGLFTLILVFLYAYMMACAIVSLFNLLKQKRLFLIVVIVIFVLLLGVDEPLVNNTINKADYLCSVDSDCVVKSTSDEGCGGYKCINKNWEHYDSIINRVFATSCIRRTYSCSCVESKCIANFSMVGRS